MSGREGFVVNLVQLAIAGLRIQRCTESIVLDTWLSLYEWVYINRKDLYYLLFLIIN